MRAWIILAVVTAALSSPVEAQRGRTRQAHRGFWAGFGIAAGSIGQSCSGCSTDRASGPAGYLRLGGTLSQKVLVGGEIAGWSLNYRGVEQNVGAAMIDLIWYPSRTGGFHVKFGAGGLTYERNSSVLGIPVNVTEAAGAFTVGLGHDFRIARNVSIVPFLNGYGSSSLKRKVNGTEITTGGDIRRDMVQLGVGLTLH